MFLVIIIKKIFNKLKYPIDVLFSIALVPASLIMLLYRKFGSHKLPFSKKILNYIGIFPLTNHYYEPQFNHDRIKKSFYENRYLPGIDFNLNKQLNNLSNLIYKNELIELNLENKSPKKIINSNNNLKKLIAKNSHIKWSNKIKKIKDLNNFYEIKKNCSKKEFLNKIRATDTSKFKPYILLYKKKFTLDN